MRFYHLIFSISLMLLLQLNSPTVFAESKRTANARAWVQRGEIALKDGHLREALLAFESAERYQSSINHKMMIAKVYEAMPEAGACLRAINTWRSVLSTLKAEKSALVPKAETKIKKLIAKCTRKISVITKPTGAKVWIDDELVGFSPLLIEVSAEAKLVKTQLQNQTQKQKLKADQSEFSFKFGTQASAVHKTEPATQSPYQKASNTLTNTKNSAIKFQAQLHCRALVEQDYQDLSSCQSRALWEGDQFKLSFESDQAVYLYVFLSNSTGQRQTLFPRDNSPNLLPAHTKSELPMGQWFTLDDVGPVTETIHVVYARNPVPAFEALRTLDAPAQKDMKIKTLAMTSMRGVVLPSSNANQGLKLSVSNTLDDQSQFIGRDEINRVEFELFHQGARPKAQ